MKRRDFLKTSAAATGLAALSTACTTTGSGRATPQASEYYELRHYHLADSADQPLLDGYLEHALIPGLNRLGSEPVGAFIEMEGKESPGVYVVIPFPTTEAFATATAKLFADSSFRAAGKDYLEAPKSKPAFNRIDSWLLRAFDGQPRITLPDYSKQKTTRIFEIRTYESHSEERALKKVEMFNSGEIEVMHEVGLGPIFFGQTLVGPSTPHLIYMLSAENRDAHKEHWASFGGHPVWKQLSGDPQYADTVSKITNRFLAPTPYSQI